ncbi:hypothetical protein LPJ62_006833, partial [Coemansia sp. RSA 2167]
LIRHPRKSQAWYPSPKSQAWLKLMCIVLMFQERGVKRQNRSAQLPMPPRWTSALWMRDKH